MTRTKIRHTRSRLHSLYTTFKELVNFAELIDIFVEVHGDCEIEIHEPTAMKLEGMLKGTKVQTSG
jgi:hypothetical protein